MNIKFLKSGKSSVIVLLVFLLAVNYLVSQKSLYLDLTQDRIYTASDVTKNILGSLKSPVTVTFYISKDLPADYVNYKTQVQDLLGQYGDLSKGKLVIKYVEPDSEDATAQSLEAKGIQQLQSQVVDKDKIEVKRFFFGAEITSGEGDGAKKEVLATIPEMEGFEYSLVSAIYSMSKDQKEVVGFLSGHGEKEISSDELKKSYEVDKVAISTDEGKKGFYAADSPTDNSSATSSDKTPADKKFVTPKALIIAGPQDKLSDGEIAFLSDYVTGGGKVVVLSEKINPDFSKGFVTKNVDSNISDFTKKFGIEINNDLVYDKSNLPVTYSQQTSFGAMQMTSDYPFWVKTVKAGFSDHPSLSKIQSLTLLWTSSLKISNGSDYDVKSLIMSSSDSEAVSQNVDISPDAKLSFASSGKKTVAAISSEKSGGGQVIVVGDSDFVSPAFMQPISDNEIFFLNLVDSVSSSANLSSIRSKNISQRPLAETSESEKSYWKFFAIAGGAIILGAYGFARINKRKKFSRA